MQLNHGIHLGYCTNIHRGEGWDETFAGLRDYTLKVKERVSPDAPYGIGLRLGADAAVELSDPAKLDTFREWLEAEACYVFTINGFPYGQFHGTRVKENVYKPDWTTTDRLEYTNRLFDILAAILPEGVPGSVSTLPGSFKEFGTDEAGMKAIFDNLDACRQHIETLSEKTGADLHLGLEPEPLGLFETSGESVKFFGLMIDHVGSASAASLLKTIGINYDTCHLAIEFEDPADALGRLRDHGIRISKLHLSSALKVDPHAEGALERLADFQEETYLHQVISHAGDDAPLRRFRDLPDALKVGATAPGEEWRVHFHVPIHAQPELLFGDTRDHIEGTLDMLGKDPSMCSHLEMETYTWEVLPEKLRAGDVVDQLEREYGWCLGAMKARGLA